MWLLLRKACAYCFVSPNSPDQTTCLLLFAGTGGEECLQRCGLTFEEVCALVMHMIKAEFAQFSLEVVLNRYLLPLFHLMSIYLMSSLCCRQTTCYHQQLSGPPIF